MMTEQSTIESARLVSLTGEVPFTVVRLPRTEHMALENPMIRYDCHFLRTGESRRGVIDATVVEFRGYGFPDGRFNPEWVSGTFKFGEGTVLLEVNPQGVKGFNFWVAEGLLGEFYKQKGADFPRIRTDRKPTRKLYGCAYPNCHEAKTSEHDLVKLLTDSEELCSIRMASLFLDRKKTWDAARGICPADVKVMNYGLVWDKHATYFVNPEIDEGYQLSNKGPNSGVVSRTDTVTFREADKVTPGRDNLFFDGSLQDMFKILQNSGIGFDKGVTDKIF